MKVESEPITDDEWLIRLVWKTKIKKDLIAVAAFEPLSNDTDGLSLYRLSCLSDPSDALAAIANPDKRKQYGIALVSVALIRELGLTVRSDRTEVPGHVVIPEINISAYSESKSRFALFQKSLAEQASSNIKLRPSE